VYILYKAVNTEEKAEEIVKAGRTGGKGQVERGRREKANRTSQLNLILTII
jgi:hypothetical protein